MALALLVGVAFVAGLFVGRWRGRRAGFCQRCALTAAQQQATSDIQAMEQATILQLIAAASSRSAAASSGASDKRRPRFYGEEEPS